MIRNTILTIILMSFAIFGRTQTLNTVVSNGNSTTLAVGLFGRADLGELYDPIQYGAVQINRPQNQGNKFHLSFIRDGSMVYGMGFLNNSNVFGIQPGSSNASSNGIFMTTNGNTGIGTTMPEALFHAAGIAIFKSQVYTDGFLTINPGGATSQGYLGWWKPGNTRVAYMGYNDGSSVNNLGLTLESANFIINGGNVGIGTNDPKGYKLAVAGSVIAESIKVKLTGAWPDYVFTKEYKLLPLEAIERHIKQTGHLPDISSAEQVKIDGIDLGVLNVNLLKKIEELTLHLIDIKKQLTAQQQQIKSLQSKIN
ncbi:MAG: hypothetical protein H7069_06795 [Phormidesmis sp. FL-bin-119]|nr:hypothetical protein [Pedobacter sp.]